MDDFVITGYFYNYGNYKLRRFLKIKRIGFEGEENDLTVVMMNPGSSKPLNSTEETEVKYLDRFVPTKPDKTQNQIGELMNMLNLNYAIIINLSDIREPKSSEFKKILTSEKSYSEHSIFHLSNTAFLNEHISSKSKFILAWGVDKKFNGLAQNAFTQIKENFGNAKCFGLRHSKNNFGFFHPLPPNYSLQKDWVSNMYKKIYENDFLEF